ncbi:glycosyltransferase [bacterium]|nr:glycosyltransferase [bacterium]
MARKVVLMTLGTRGDVQPYLALGQGLKHAGFDVTLATDANFANDARNHGLEFAPVRADFRAIVESPEGRAALTGDPRAILRLVRHTVLPMTHDLLEDFRMAADGAAAIIYHPKAIAAPHLAEATGIPTWAGFFLPMLSPTRDFPIPILTSRSLGGLGNRLSYRFLDISTLFLAGIVNRWRRESLGLMHRMPRGFERQLPVLYGFSRHVIPPPADWGEQVHVTGYWFLDEPPGWQPPDELARFLAAGPPPVYVGFGSMSSRDPAETARTVFEAVRLAGCRAIVSEGWGGLSAGHVPDDVLAIQDVPHSWLFRQVAAVVHHGGAGTTAAAIRAGKPSIVCPFVADQPFWGHQVHKLGIGPKPIRQRRLRAGNLAGAIERAVNDKEMQSRALELGEKVAAEDGVARAVEIFSRLWHS